MNTPHKEIHIGGQAVIEGVVMRSPTMIATAVRKPNKEIVVDIDQNISWTKRYPLLGLVFIRGIVVLVESMVIGFRKIAYSANMALEEKERLNPKEFAISFILSLVLAVGLFMALPAFVFTQLRGSIPSTLLLNLIEGLIRIGIFLIFLVLVSFMPDMRRVFAYHGAEHKAIKAYESLKDKGVPNIQESLTVEGAKNYSLLHRRCGTSFLLIVLITSILVFAFLGRPPFLVRILLKLSLLPVVAGISYELMKLSARKNAFFLLRWLTAPGVWLQYLTTREPDGEQLEVALTALKAVT